MLVIVDMWDAAGDVHIRMAECAPKIVGHCSLFSLSQGHRVSVKPALQLFVLTPSWSCG